jgi:hypothetical protein
MQSFTESLGLHAQLYEHKTLQANLDLGYRKRFGTDEGVHQTGPAQEIEALL